MGDMRSLIADVACGQSVARFEVRNPCRTHETAPSLPDRGDAGIGSRRVAGKHRGRRGERHGIKAALARASVAPTVRAHRPAGIAVLAPHQPCILRLGVHDRAERCRRLRPGGALGFQRCLDVPDTGEECRLVNVLPRFRVARAVALHRVEHPCVHLESAGRNRLDVAERFGFHGAKPLIPCWVGHPRESFKHAPILRQHWSTGVGFLPRVRIAFPCGMAGTEIPDVEMRHLPLRKLRHVSL